MTQGKVALLACGSFNPPTFMHLRMFEIARDYLQGQGMRVVGGMVSPVHDGYGKKDLASATHRCAMLRLALRSSDWIKLSEWEVQQEGWSRTRHVLEHHQSTLNAATRGSLASPPGWLPDDLTDANSVDQMDNMMSNGDGDAYNNNLNNNNNNNGAGGDVSVRLLCGADLLESFATPGLWAEEDLEVILGQHGLVVVTRAGTDPSRFIYESDILYKYRRQVTVLTNWVANEVSSTALRRLLRRGESIKYLTDDGVAAYAASRQLYGSPGANLAHIEYNILPDLTPSPQDVAMLTPTENYKNILISIRDRPSIVDETVTVTKRPKKTNFIMPNTRTDSVSPMCGVAPKMAYLDAAPPGYIPGKAVKIVANASKKHTIVKNDAEVSYDVTDSIATTSKDVWERRVSAGAVESDRKSKVSSTRSLGGTIKKMEKFSMGSIRKSLSEVGRLSEKMRGMSVKEKEVVNYKTRSCNDIVKLVLTKHGIHVISDTEAIVRGVHVRSSWSGARAGSSGGQAPHEPATSNSPTPEIRRFTINH